MRARIHRGAAEVGGNCVEVEHDGTRLVLDLGLPLTARHGEHVPLPDVPGLAGGDDPSLLGVILTHGHADHWGLMPQVHPGVPRYIGKAAADILRAAVFWGTGVDLHETGHLHHREAFTLGPFTITPYLADHSAFDAYSLLIQAGTDRLFYTGDIRGHGRKGARFTELLADPPTGVDVLLCEGTNVHPETLANSAGPVVTETNVERDLATTLSGTDGLVVVLGSPQNIDRLVTTYRACLRAGRDLVVDLYGADIATATGRATIPRPGPDWPRVHVDAPLRQRVRVKTTGQFDRVHAVRAYRIFDEHLTADPARYALFGTYSSEIGHLITVLRGRLGAVAWSMWDGYLTEPSGQALTARLADAGVPLIHHHTSGHAPPTDLARLARALRPRVVVPIHTTAPTTFATLLEADVTPHADGTWWPVDSGTADGCCDWSALRPG